MSPTEPDCTLLRSTTGVGAELHHHQSHLAVVNDERRSAGDERGEGFESPPQKRSINFPKVNIRVTEWLVGAHPLVRGAAGSGQKMVFFYRYRIIEIRLQLFSVPRWYGGGRRADERGRGGVDLRCRDLRVTKSSCKFADRFHPLKDGGKLCRNVWERPPFHLCCLFLIIIQAPTPRKPPPLKLRKCFSLCGSKVGRSSRR